MRISDWSSDVCSSDLTVGAAQGVLFNVVALLDGGEVTAIRQKRELPNYGTFDEKRLFAPGPLPAPVEFRGAKLGFPICEDIWFPFVCAHLKEQGADILISPNGSPYEINKDERRIDEIGTAERRQGKASGSKLRSRGST